MKPLSDEEWSKFFDLLGRIVQEKGKTYAEKKDQFASKVIDYEAESAIGEFAGFVSDE